jgi:hypothetical protein
MFLTQSCERCCYSVSGLCLEFLCSNSNKVGFAWDALRIFSILIIQWILLKFSPHFEERYTSTELFISLSSSTFPKLNTFLRNFLVLVLQVFYSKCLLIIEFPPNSLIMVITDLPIPHYSLFLHNLFIMHCSHLGEQMIWWNLWVWWSPIRCISVSLIFYELSGFYFGLFSRA